MAAACMYKIVAYEHHLHLEKYVCILIATVNVYVHVLYVAYMVTTTYMPDSYLFACMLGLLNVCKGMSVVLGTKV